jgi:nitronate monooxygenase
MRAVEQDRLHLVGSAAAVHQFCDRFGIELPIVQGPMNGASPPELVAVVSNARGLGSLAASLLSPQAILESAKKVRALTGR